MLESVWYWDNPTRDTSSSGVNLMVAATTEPGPITAGTAEESAIADLARLLDDQGQQPLTLVGLTGEQIE